MSPIDVVRPRVRWKRYRLRPMARCEAAGGERFLQGPIPLAWLEAAAKLPGKSLHVGVLLWCAAGAAGSVSVPLGNISSWRFGLDRNAKYRALGWLEAAGLIAVQRKLGRAPIVTIFDLESLA